MVAVGWLNEGMGFILSVNCVYVLLELNTGTTVGIGMNLESIG
jgi:hypothetical protein